jgi:cyclopropane-fatty-acyl-phospholipid synthase
MEDWHNFGADYDKTLMCWFENFSKNWNAISHLYDNRSFRMWKYYLLSCAGAFRVRELRSFYGGLKRMNKTAFKNW